MGKIKVDGIGLSGVNVDDDPISLDDRALIKAQNAIREPLGASKGIRKRPGLINLNTTTGAGSILGGIGVPSIDRSSNGVTILYIGRGGVGA